MKKLILTILTTITIFGVNAQGNNLQFNQSIFFDLSNTNQQSGIWESSGTFTVPANKTWKITSTSCYESGSNEAYYSNVCKLKINNHIINNSSAVRTAFYPLWLPQGTYTVYTYTNITNYSSFSSISGIEFNIVP
jgi:hypothetical protein